MEELAGGGRDQIVATVSVFGNDSRAVVDVEAEGICARPSRQYTMTNTRAHHVGVTVADLERAVEFYRGTLGLEVLDRFTVSGEPFADGVGVEGATGDFVHLDGGGARIELIEYDPEGRAQDAASVNQPGAKHVGLAVPDIDGFYEDLPGAVETLSEPRTTESGTRILFLRDPEDNLVEIIEA